ncbi:MAG: glycosyltransferase [Succinivibrionaceae bacterium]
MLGPMIKTVRCLFYKYPKINEDVLGLGKFANLKIALLTDYLTTVNIAYECRIRCLTTKNFQSVLKEWNPDFIFIESAFHGYNWSWSYKLAKHSKIFDLNYLNHFKKMIKLAQDLKIPTVFWNKDDGEFFETFIDAASLCDYIYTADICSVERYKNHLYSTNSLIIKTPNKDQSIEKQERQERQDFYTDGIRSYVNGKGVGVMKMAIQPRTHNFKGFAFCKKAMCFAGSYYRNILDNRRIFLNNIFEACDDAHLQVDIYDRNSNRISRNFDFKFPKFKNLKVFSKLTNEQTADIYRQYNVSLNVNSITGSETMCSRRLLEIIACGGIVATNSSKAVETLFKDYCTVLHSKEEAKELLPGMVMAPNKENLEKAEAGSLYISKNFTWEKRLEQILEDIKIIKWR